MESKLEELLRKSHEVQIKVAQDFAHIKKEKDEKLKIREVITYIVK